MFVEALKLVLMKFKTDIKKGRFGADLQHKSELMDAQNKILAKHKHSKKNNDADNDFRRKPLQYGATNL